MAKKTTPDVKDTVWGVYALPNNIPLWANPNYLENTCRVLAPSDAQPKGLLVLLPGQGGDSSYLRKVISRPIYDNIGKVDMSLYSSVSHDLPNPGYLNGHTDNQLVRAKDGSFLAVKSCLNWAPIANPKPSQRICIRDREPDTHFGCRGTEVVWRGQLVSTRVGAELEWQMQGFIDPYVLGNGLYGYPRPLGCPDDEYPNGRPVSSLSKQCKDPVPWTCSSLAAQCNQLKQEIKNLKEKIDDYCDPELIKHSSELGGKCKGWVNQLNQKGQQAAAWACDLQGWWTAPGSDRPEVYACPFTGYLYLTATFKSGQFPLPDGTTAPHREDTRVLFSRDQGKSWDMLNFEGSPMSGPLVITSTPNGRLFLYHWGRDSTRFYGRLLCSNIFDYKNNAVPKIAQVILGNEHKVGVDPQGGHYLSYEPLPTSKPLGILEYWDIVNGSPIKTQPPDVTMKENDETIAHPSISRVSADGSTSRVRVSLLALNVHGRNIYAIVDIGVVDQGGQPSLEPGSLRLAGRIEARDPANYSVLHGTFIDPDYISMPPDVVSNASLFYWLEWPRRIQPNEPPNWTLPQDMSVRGCIFDGSPSTQSKIIPLSVTSGALRSWKGHDPGGDYMSGGFFYHNGLNYLAQWREPDAIRANIVRYIPQPTINIRVP